MSSITILMRPTVELLVIRREEKQSTETKRGRTMKLTMEIPRVPIAIFPAGGLYHANSMRLLDCARDMTSRCSQLECLSAHGFCRPQGSLVASRHSSHESPDKGSQW